MLALDSWKKIEKVEVDRRFLEINLVGYKLVISLVCYNLVI